MIASRTLALVAVLAGFVCSAPTRRWTNSSTFFSVGQNYADEWQAFATGTGKTPAGISVYGDIWSGELNSDSVNLLSTYSASHSGYVEVGMSWKDAMTQNGYTIYQGASLCDDIANGKYDSNLQKLGNYLAQYPNVHYLLRVDYEVSGNLHANTNPSTFDASTWDTTAYPKAFAHVRSVISGLVKNVQFVYHPVRSQAKVIYPGDDVVDFQGASVFNNDVCLSDAGVMGCQSGVLDPNLQADLAAATKPKLISESAAQPPSTDSSDGFISYLTLVKNLVETYDVCGWTYINSNWNVHGWDNTWGDSRIEANPAVLQWFQQNIIGNPRYTFGQ